MTLLVFSHRKEAQIFSKSMVWNSCEHPFENLFLNEKYALLISREGLFSSHQALSMALGFLHPKVIQVVNMGVCGAIGLDEKCLEKIFSIRTFYAHNGADMMFHSYTSQDTQATIDIVSSHQRVLTKKQADHLKPFAPLVDCEAWAHARVCTSFKIPFYSYKLVSDTVPSKENLCEITKQRATEWSQNLWDYYFEQETDDIKNISLFPSRKNRNKNDDFQKKSKSNTQQVSSKRFPEQDILHCKGGPGEYEIILENIKPYLISYYFTHTQKKQFLFFIKKWLAREKNIKKVLESLTFYLKQSSLQNITPKLRSKDLLRFLEEKALPLQSKIKNKLSKEIEKDMSYSKPYAKIQFDPSLEEPELTITARVKNKEDVENLYAQLKTINFASIDRIFSGENISLNK